MNKPLSSDFLKQKGQCCGSKCVNCPYVPQWQKGSTNVKKKFPTDR